MSLPSGAGYATIIYDAPTGDVSGFTALLDAETKLGALTDFTNDIDTTDGSRGRVAANADDTEYAFDWIADDVSADLELLAVGVGTVLAASTDAARTLKIFAPNTRNTAYGVSDTYGQYNAYPSDCEGYYPFSSNAVDRTSNQRNGSIVGTASYASSVLGNGIQNEVTLPTNPFTANDGVYISAWVDTPATADIVEDWPTSFLLRASSGTLQAYAKVNAAVLGPASQSISTGSHKIALRFESESGGYSTTTLYTYLDGVVGTPDTDAFNADLQIGASITVNDGALLNHISQLWLYSDARSANFESYVNAQTSDNSTFWGTPTWVSGGGSVELNVTGAQIQSGVISIQSPAQLSISGDQPQAAQVSVQIPAQFNVSGSQPQAGSITLQITTQLQVSGDQGQDGNITLKTVSGLRVEGSQGQDGTVHLSVPTQLSINGEQSQDGIIDIQIPAELSIAGEQSQGGDVTIGEVVKLYFIQDSLIFNIQEIDGSLVFLSDSMEFKVTGDNVFLNDDIIFGIEEI